MVLKSNHLILQTIFQIKIKAICAPGLKSGSAVGITINLPFTFNFSLSTFSLSTFYFALNTFYRNFVYTEVVELFTLHSFHLDNIHQEGKSHREINVAFRDFEMEAFGKKGNSDHHQET